MEFKWHLDVSLASALQPGDGRIPSMKRVSKRCSHLRIVIQEPWLLQAPPSVVLRPHPSVDKKDKDTNTLSVSGLRHAPTQPSFLQPEPCAARSLYCRRAWVWLLGSSLNAHKVSKERAGSQLVLGYSSSQLVALIPLGTFPCGRTKLRKRNEAILVLWDLFTELEDQCNILNTSPVDLETEACKINFACHKVRSLPYKIPCIDHEEPVLVHLNSGLKLFRVYHFCSFPAALLPLHLIAVGNYSNGEQLYSWRKNQEVWRPSRQPSLFPALWKKKHCAHGCRALGWF